MKLVLSLIALMFSFSVQAAEKKGFHCTAYDIIDVYFSGVIVDGKAVVEPGDLHVAIIDVPYLVPAEQVTMSLGKNSEGDVFHVVASEEGKKPFIEIRAVDGIGRTSMDFKGVRLYKTPTACNFGR